MLLKNQSNLRLAVTVCLLFACGKVSFSQGIPGYMGKRMTISYGADLMIAASPTAGSSDGGLNHSHSLNFEYAIRNRTNFCFSMRYFKTGISLGSYQSRVGGYVTYYPVSKRPMQLNSYNFGIGYKFFHRGYLAPVGKYRKPEVLILINNVKYEKDQFRQTDTGMQNVSVGTGSLVTSGLGITYQLGRQSVIADKVVLDAGVRFGLMLNGFFSNAGSFLLEIDNYSNYSLDSKLEQEIKNRVFLHEIFNVHIGIGFLAF